MNLPRSTRRLRDATLGEHGPRAGRRGLPPPGTPPALLVPMVRRALSTGRGPAALLAWLRGQQARGDPARDPSEWLALALASDLLRLPPVARPAAGTSFG